MLTAAVRRTRQLQTSCVASLPLPRLTTLPPVAVFHSVRRSFVSTGDSRAAGPGHAVTAADLRAALYTLNLRDDCTDAEVKRAFRAFAILHHPDASATAASVPDARNDRDTAPFTRSTTAATAADTMHRGTEAYHLLRQTSYALRQRILQEDRHGGGAGTGRFRGPYGDFQFTAEEYAKAQKIYQGDRHRRRQRRGGSAGTGTSHEDVNAALFDMDTEEGRRRAARFEAAKARIAEMRRHGHRDDLPPWRVDDFVDGASTATFNAAGTPSSNVPPRGTSPDDDRGGRSGAQQQQPRTSGSSRSRKPNGLGLHFFKAIVSNLKNVRDLYTSRPGFAGIDGSSYDNPGSAARVAPELTSNPHLRQYILMKHRAQEKANVDNAVKQPLLLFLILVCSGVLVLIAAKIAQSCGARARQDEELRRCYRERGGA